MNKKVIPVFLLGLTCLSTSAFCEPVTLALALTLKATYLTRSAIQKGLHCNVLCNRKTCATAEWDIKHPTEASLKKKLEDLSGFSLSGRYGIAKWCAMTCNSGTEPLAFSVMPETLNQTPAKPHNLSISVKKLYKGSRTIRNCVQAYNDATKNSSRVNPSKEISVYSDQELEKIKSFSRSNDYHGYLTYVTSTIDTQIPTQWEIK